MFSGVNTLLAVGGALRAVGGTINAVNLTDLSDRVRDKRDDLAKVDDEFKAYLKAVKTAGSVEAMEDAKTIAVKFAELEAKREERSRSVERAQARLDRAQNRNEWWNAGMGAFVGAAGMGFGQPDQLGLTQGGGALPQIPQVPQGQQVVMMQAPGGGWVPALLGAGIGGFIGAELGSNNNRSDRRDRP